MVWRCERQVFVTVWQGLVTTRCQGYVSSEMAAYLEVLAHEPRLVPLEGERLTVGTDVSNDLALPADATLSRLHAVFDRYPSGWCVRDLDSRNGTFVNGERVRL